ncbi:hypothetical protein [Nitrosomonas nitrosa]|uniref:hypothetical protein n=1 Tax=Nitrosomonas nitrosa TaxID=52442 RepID=UPI0015E79DE5|nr:hypothetical protein [Nitrosomonas nitrosa]
MTRIRPLAHSSFILPFERVFAGIELLGNGCWACSLACTGGFAAERGEKSGKSSKDDQNDRSKKGYSASFIRIMMRCR